MPYETLLTKKEGSTVTVVLNRPSKLNAMNEQMISELLQFLQDMREDSHTRMIIFTGNGQTFSAGVDLEVLDKLGKNRSLVRNGQLLGHDFMRTLENLEQITFAALNGPAVGAGLSLAMACDFRIMSDDAFLSIPEASVGMFFTWGCTQRLVSLIGPSMAKELIMTCDMVGSQKALQIGLVNKVVTPHQVMPTVHEMAQTISGKAHLAIRMTKKIVNASAASGFGDLYLCEPELVERLYLSGEPREGLEAFMEKRLPEFSGE
ncbi:MAG: enoyl-CoA hydratase/isomerase family protein [Desulfobacterales bacterium]